MYPENWTGDLDRLLCQQGDGAKERGDVDPDDKEEAASG
jgi:hypothetical protein